MEGDGLGQVEMLVPDFEELNEDGAQQRVWDLARLFLDTLQESLGDQVCWSHCNSFLLLTRL